MSKKELQAQIEALSEVIKKLSTEVSALSTTVVNNKHEQLDILKDIAGKIGYEIVTEDYIHSESTSYYYISTAGTEYPQHKTIKQRTVLKPITKSKKSKQ